MRSSWFSRTPRAAARCALDLQDAMASIDSRPWGFPGTSRSGSALIWGLYSATTTQ